jgi:hypothetical protein
LVFPQTLNGLDGGNGGNGISVDGCEARLLAGNGDDLILGVGGNGGDGGDGRQGSLTSTSGNGGDGGDGGNGLTITGKAQVITGNGDDWITGVGGQGGEGGLRGRSTKLDGDDGANGYGIFNDTITGTIASGITKYGIDTGNGNDVVDASQGGFGGGGAINMGKGNDVVRGFGAQVIEAGSGYDVLDLGGLVGYSTTNAGNGWTKITAGGVDMLVRGFEAIV